jgi:hypothetical protein
MDRRSVSGGKEAGVGLQWDRMCKRGARRYHHAIMERHCNGCSWRSRGRYSGLMFNSRMVRPKSSYSFRTMALKSSPHIPTG